MKLETGNGNRIGHPNRPSKGLFLGENQVLDTAVMQKKAG
jgi:hypothetical protein